MSLAAYPADFLAAPLPIPLAPDPAADTEMELLARYRDEGDQDAFAEIVRRYAPAVFTTAMRVLANRARADDVSQETFFRLSQKPDAVTQSLGGWLHTAATRLAIDAARSESSRAHREAAYEPPPQSEATVWSEISPHVDQALAELPDEARTLLVRHFLMGKTQCQLAAEMGASPATVCRKIKQGVQTLRERLRGKGIVVAVAALVTLLREHGAAAAAVPVELAHELGKITMLSGGKPLAVKPATMSASGTTVWTAGITLLATLFGVMTWLIIPAQQSPKPDAQPLPQTPPLFAR